MTFDWIGKLYRHIGSWAILSHGRLRLHADHPRFTGPHVVHSVHAGHSKNDFSKNFANYRYIKNAINKLTLSLAKCQKSPYHQSILISCRNGQSWRRHLRNCHWPITRTVAHWQIKLFPHWTDRHFHLLHGASHAVCLFAASGVYNYRLILT